MSDAGDIPVLWQITFSHYNEKARWALDHKRVSHRRRSLAPGLHAIKARRLWGGATTPVLEIDDRCIGDSAAIIAEIERRWPEPALYPGDEAERRRALDLEQHFGKELGPFIRGAVFDAILDHRDVLIPLSGQDLGVGTRLSQRLLYPVNRRIIRRILVDGIGGPEVCRAKTVAALDRLEQELGGGEHLVGNRFTVADLTAAALFSPLVAPPEFSYYWPERWPPRWQGLRDELADRPGYRWVEDTYRRHRGTSAAVAG